MNNAFTVIAEQAHRSQTFHKLCNTLGRYVEKRSLAHSSASITAKLSPLSMLLQALSIARPMN